MNIENHASTCSFHSRCLETRLHWNNGISIDNLKVGVIVLVDSMFVNLKLHLLNEITFLKIIKHVVMKAKQTYIQRLSFHWTSYLRVNESHCEGTPFNIVASYSMSPHHESIYVPQVPVLGRHVMTRGRQHHY